MKPTLIGLALGVFGSTALHRLLAGFFFGVSAHDPRTLGGVAALLVAGIELGTLGPIPVATVLIDVALQTVICTELRPECARAPEIVTAPGAYRPLPYEPGSQNAAIVFRRSRGLDRVDQVM